MIVLRLSELPPSVNNLHVNVRGKGRSRTSAYRMWAKSSGWELLEQRPGQLEGPVAIVVEVGPGRSDLDNMAKGILDLLVAHRIIVDDGPDFVRELTLRRVVGHGVRITVTPHQPTEKAQLA